jgi:uncharacterized protein GlcG (DUF336 family)
MMDALTLTGAQTLIGKAIAMAADDGARPIAVAVVDAAGDLLAFVRQDGMPARSVAIVQGKAYTAVRLGITTAAFHQRLAKENLRPSDFCDDRLTAMAGGAVLRDGAGRLLGAIGVTGLAASEDQEIVDRLAGLLSEGAL